ncbi:sugar ABC transporter permease [Marinomonas sp. A3A]|jgi:D-xylose transport system permease protein|uniref:Xylose transport system permease protein XylH n=1 Tax=Marinomonas polaris DSM 16579 TaxID=1122206 RepID=A0A1M5HN90_9GAMM|nr:MULTISPECIES: sugar ABC transporter permease [Marinomonas]MBU1294937.1 sugar ABC transporter permease [Gammaproteobacteria bacterium]MBU1467937.1 sugar ABC transporter permease [Gammaproteobacteria bacterium]MBU2024892.1 sugar ABC transporter permease [Gammaproteobacteria bacterium]MBU2237649.1 sugar ABC transporter permease [Gammaproteobacteria bacterium]MBU2317908.1 sugar ABC transporter permease [Gammaproteobacteria bacterium]|tara:strand:+ start:2036 stop:3166 length:1131 start_codon:yes stop_codon:yes gene_type:complete
MFKTIKTSQLQLFAMLAAMLLIVVFFSIATDGAFISPRNISNLIRQTAIVGVLAIGMVFVIISAEIDLSVGSMMGLLGGIAAILDVWFNFPILLTVLVTVVAGLVLGLFNGWWVAYQRVPSFIVTLAGMLAFRGILVGLTDGATVAPTSSSLAIIGQSYIPSGWGISVVGLLCLGLVAKVYARRKARKQHGVENKAAKFEYAKAFVAVAVLLVLLYALESYRGIPTPILIMGGLILIATYVAKRTAFGRRVYAIGGNIEATRMSGVNVERTKMLVFGFNGMMVAVAALILTSRLGAGSPAAGNMAELDAIAACVIGGTSLAGGVGAVFGAIMGALIMASLDNGMSMLDVPTFWQLIVKGMILLLAVWLDVKTKKAQ